MSNILNELKTLSMPMVSLTDARVKADLAYATLLVHCNHQKLDLESGKQEGYHQSGALEQFPAGLLPTVGAMLSC